jgi:hypothetical protein
MRIPAIISMKAIEPYRCPTSVARDTERACESLASTILVVNPPPGPIKSLPLTRIVAIRLIPLCSVTDGT